MFTAEPITLYFLLVDESQISHHKAQPPHLDAHNTALGFDNLGEGTPIICLLIKRLMEEDDTPNAGIHTVVSSQQQLAVEATVLLGVFSANRLQPLGNAPWKGASHGNKGSTTW